MSEALIRQQIYTTLSGVTSIGKVHDYERWAADWDAFIALFKTTVAGAPQIRGWEIGREAVAAVYDDNAEESDTHQFVIRGYLVVKDSAATEKTFNALIEAVRQAFRFDFTLGGLCEMAGPMTARVITTRMFGAVLCHYCELVFPVQEVLTT
jgi:hypothetical protein